MKIILSLVFLVIYGNVFSQIEKTINCNFKYDILVNGKTRKVKMVCLIPKDIEKSQKVKSIKFSIQPDSIFERNDNKYAMFTILNPIKKQNLTISATIDLYVNDFSENKSKKQILRDSIFEFLNDEKYIEKDNENIKQKALELKGKNTEQTLKNIYSFVNSKVKYIGYNSKDIGALITLFTKSGDCTEFSDLFVALCRSNNIPARFVEGLTLDYNDTPKHCWVEVYMNKYGWVRFDPTTGNSSTFEKMQNRYIQLSTVRNDLVLNNYHFYANWYWGDSVEINQNFEIKIL